MHALDSARLSGCSIVRVWPQSGVQIATDVCAPVRNWPNVPVWKERVGREVKQANILDQCIVIASHVGVGHAQWLRRLGPHSCSQTSLLSTSRSVVSCAVFRTIPV